MRKIWKLLHSPRNLIIFEAAARLNSFTLAAKELGIQQPSVSAAIKQLETALGVKLFQRGHRLVTLTEAGNRLFASAAWALSDIEKTAADISLSARDTHVTINSSTAFSYFWMMPQVHKLRQKHPDIDLRMQNSDREPNLDEENISLGVRLGDGNWPGVEVAPIAKEVIFPVASPLAFPEPSEVPTIKSLLDQRLIHLEEPIRPRPRWQDWFAHHGITNRDLSAGLKLNDYALVLQAALSGEGIAFGWAHIVERLVDQGLLIAWKDWAWRTGNQIFLVWSSKSPLSADAIKVRDWVLENSKLA